MSQSYKILAIDHVHFYVGNARQAAVYYQKLYGFEAYAYRGLETGERENASYLLKQNRVQLLFSTPYSADSRLNEFLRLHGDGVKDVAFEVDDTRAAFSDALQNGAQIIREPQVLKDEYGSVIIAAIQTYGDTIHTFVERQNYRGLFLPGFVRMTSPIKSRPVGFRYIDHIVGNQPEHEMEQVAQFYERVLHFHRFWTVDDKDIHTEYSSLRSVVVANESEIIKMPINEPADGLKKSQIQEYVEFNNGAGVQHIALYTDDILATIKNMRANGVEFLQVPTSYYELLSERVGKIDENIQELAQLGILVDRDEYGYMLQIFTKPVQDRPTFFFEVIQRKGSASFGKGNFKALFEAIEREQDRRGNL